MYRVVNDNGTVNLPASMLKTAREAMMDAVARLDPDRDRALRIELMRSVAQLDELASALVIHGID